jgi:hypothetical protein
MEEARNLSESIKCDKCGKEAAMRIKTDEGIPLRLCDTHEDKFAEKLKEKMMDKFEGMSEEEISKEILQKGESLL